MASRPPLLEIRKSVLTLALTFVMAAGQSAIVHAGEANVDSATVRQDGNTWHFDVTVSHADEGWEHYADQWDVVASDGRVLASRALAHPHVNEQPFTRSLSGVEIPDDIREVVIRARDSVHGYGGREFRLVLPRQE